MEIAAIIIAAIEAAGEVVSELVALFKRSRSEPLTKAEVEAEIARITSRSANYDAEEDAAAKGKGG